MEASFQPHRACALAFLACAFVSLLQAAPPIPETSTPIETLPGSYTAMVRQGDKVYFFSEQLATGVPNASGKICPGINVYAAEGPGFTKAAFLKTVAPNALINDLFSAPDQLDAARLVTRLGVAFSEKDQRYYALGYVSRSYPPSDGQVAPALYQSDTADPLGGWTYRGKITLDGKPFKGFSSGNNLILNDNHGSTVNHAAPLENKFAHYIDLKSLNLIYSNDGLEWFSAKNADGKPADLRPEHLRSDAGWIFPSAVRTKNDGYFLTITAGWPPQGHRLLHSMDGLEWKQVGSDNLKTNFGGLPKSKNVSLTYDGKTDTLYFLITRTGSEHFKNIVAVKPRDLIPPAERK